MEYFTTFSAALTSNRATCESLDSRDDSHPTYEEIVAELARLRRQRSEALAKATFYWWTREEMAMEETRLKRIETIQRMLVAEAPDDVSIPIEADVARALA